MRLFGRIARGVQALRATRLWVGSTRDRQNAILSSAGAGAGSFWAAVPSEANLRCGNAVWQVMAGLKIDAIRRPAAATTCQLPVSSGDGDDVCGQTLDDKLRHADLCRCAGRMRSHRAICATLAAELKRKGAAIDMERAVPEMLTVDSDGNFHDRIMDVIAQWPGSASSVLIDCTIRSPWAMRYNRGSVTAGRIGRVADREKWKHYGLDVAPIAFETLGRISPGGANALRTLQSEASDWSTKGPLDIRRLRMSLETCVIRSSAECLIRTLGNAGHCAIGTWARSGSRRSEGDADQ